MKALEEHGERLATGTAERWRQQIAEQVGSELGDASVTVDGAEIVASGGHLLRQWLSNASLRHLRRQS